MLVKRGISPRKEHIAEPAIGLLHLEALATIRDGVLPAADTGAEALLQGLWQSETESWQKTLQDHRWGLTFLSKSQIERAILALVLLEPTDVDSAIAILRRIDELKESDRGTLANVVEWARFTYPPIGASALLSFEPRLVSDAAFLQRASDEPAFGHALLDSLTETDAARVWRRLVDVSSLLPTAAKWAASMIGSDSEQLGLVLEVILERAPTDQTLDRELASHIADVKLTDAQVTSLQRRMSAGHLPRTHVALARQRVQHLRNSDTQSGRTHGAELADALRELAAAEMKVGGRATSALLAADEAIALYRQLDQQAPGSYEPELAAILTELAAILLDVGGRVADATAAVEGISESLPRVGCAEPHCSSRLAGRCADQAL